MRCKQLILAVIMNVYDEDIRNYGIVVDVIDTRVVIIDITVKA